MESRHSEKTGAISLASLPGGAGRWDRKEILFLLISAAVLGWSVFRAQTQSITLDEADSYFWFAGRELRYVWFPFPNNHILNTALMWISTRLFGLHHLSVRLPALGGAAVYIGSCYLLTRQLAGRWLPRLILYLCLLLNPFVLDFLAAARGYSLALGFLMAALAVPLSYRPGSGASLLRRCALASTALGLSFCANFSFALVDLAAWTAIAAWALLARRGEAVWRLGAALVGPGLAIAAALGGYALTHWPGKEMWYGSQSIAESGESLLEASLYQLDRSLAGTPAYVFLGEAMPMALLAAAGLGAVQILLLGVEAVRRRGRLEPRQGFALAVAAILALTVAAHWLLFTLAGVLLPLTRTGIYFPPLCILLLGALAVTPVRPRFSAVFRGGVAAVLLGLAVYSAGCLRYTYFKEYEWDAEVKEAYAVLDRLYRRYGVTEVAANGLYRSPLNFERIVAGAGARPEYGDLPENRPVASPVFVLRLPYHQPVIEREKLTVIFAGRFTEIAVAVRAGSPMARERF